MDQDAQDRFVSEVFSYLPPGDCSEEVERVFENDIAAKARQGWTVENCIRYVMTFEEFNPLVPEEVALKKRQTLIDRHEEKCGSDP